MSGRRSRGAGPEAPSAVCAICGRRMPASARPGQKRCSQRCRGSRLGQEDRALEAAILALLDRRAQGASLCPSEATHQVFGPDRAREAGPRERARQAARRLVAAGAIEICQGGRRVDPSTARGPIRLRRPR